MMSSFFDKKPNRKAQAAVTGAVVVIAGLATSFISIPVLLAGGAAWWVTGKATEK